MNFVTHGFKSDLSGKFAQPESGHLTSIFLSWTNSVFLNHKIEKYITKIEKFKKNCILEVTLYSSFLQNSMWLQESETLESNSWKFEVNVLLYIYIWTAIRSFYVCLIFPTILTSILLQNCKYVFEVIFELMGISCFMIFETKYYLTKFSVLKKIIK